MSTWGNFEFSELTRLAKTFQKSIDERVVERFIKDFLLDMAYKAQRKIKFLTPENTGDLRNKWTVGRVERHGSSYVVEIFNPLEYASFIENGFRAHWVPGEWVSNQFKYIPGHNKGMQVGEKNGWVEGRFMMHTSIKEIERELPRYLERRSAELLNNIVNGRPN